MSWLRHITWTWRQYFRTVALSWTSILDRLMIPKHQITFKIAKKLKLMKPIKWYKDINVTQGIKITFPRSRRSRGCWCCFARSFASFFFIILFLQGEVWILFRHYVSLRWSLINNEVWSDSITFFLLSVSLLTNFSHINLSFSLFESLFELIMKAFSSLPLTLIWSTFWRGIAQISHDLSGWECK